MVDPRRQGVERAVDREFSVFGAIYPRNAQDERRTMNEHFFVRLWHGTKTALHDADESSPS